MASQNFAFLVAHGVLFDPLAEAAERNLAIDPNTSLIKLRQLAEAMAQSAAASLGVYAGPQASQVELLRALEDRGFVQRDVATLFHAIRKSGNEATHQFAGSRGRALEVLKLSRELAVWFHRTFGGVAAQTFKPGPFVAPEDPSAKLKVLESELAELRAEQTSAKQSAEAARKIAEIESRRRSEAEDAAKLLRQEAETWAQLASEQERIAAQLRTEFEARLAEQQRAGAQLTEQQVRVQRGKAEQAAVQIHLDEAQTRQIIDLQLRQAGWIADSVELTYAKGARPEHGKNKAIAEWPTESGPADYVLFRGMTPLAVVEAKRKAKNAYSAVDQAKRYSVGFRATDELRMPRPPGASAEFPGWPTGLKSKNGAETYFRIPFLFATNGRDFQRQFEQESGIWRLDARLPTNHASPLPEWHTPDGLAAELEVNVPAADEALKQEPTDYLGLREYQVKAIRAVEEAIAQGKRECLLAMATGTGKTRTVIGLIYRLLKTKRFRRVLFLVDRSSLGEQAQNAFKEVRLENHLFSETYDVKELGDIKPDASTRVQIATVQSLVKRILYPTHEEDRPPVDQYDCIIVDESHRGYTLDREMSEGEAWMRDFGEYISTYRRVLDYFDAVKVGLTATPALHTRQIFGDPVFDYTYTEAVADGYLVDYEPPIRLRTRLAENGITFEKGAEVEVFEAPGQMELWQLEDEVKFEIDAFNRQVVTEGFNRVVCDYLATVLDPQGDEKTLIFCVNDAHSDLVVRLMKDALDQKWGGVHDDTVLKITGGADKPDERIRRYKNEKLPNIAVTVDLLTTGIDVPKICNLVFLRRVRSRILYDQMLGRATRLCDEIGKETFRIYDAVDLYAALEQFSEMKPLVKDVDIPIGDLLHELASPAAQQAPGSEDGNTHADDVLRQLVERLRRKVRRASGEKAKVSAEFQEAANLLEAAIGAPLSKLPNRLHEMGAASVAALLREKPEVGALIEQLHTAKAGKPRGVYIHQGEDELIGVETVLPNRKSPKDYLEEFKGYVIENMNKLPALSVVVQRPRDLTRKQLRDLEVALSTKGYGEPTLKKAWQQLTNEEIAASVVGFIRQQALGSPLLDYSARVDAAMRKILAQQAWTKPQRDWLDRIAMQLKREKVVDREALDEEPFRDRGGFRHINKAFEGKLEAVLGELHEEIWRDAG